MINFDQLEIALLVAGLSLDFTTKDSRVFQAAGDPRLVGFYQRFFHADRHPTRQRIDKGKCELAFAEAASFTLYTSPNKGELVSEKRLQTMVETWFGAKS